MRECLFQLTSVYVHKLLNECVYVVYAYQYHTLILNECVYVVYAYQYHTLILNECVCVCMCVCVWCMHTSTILNFMCTAGVYSNVFITPPPDISIAIYAERLIETSNYFLYQAHSMVSPHSQ